MAAQIWKDTSILIGDLEWACNTRNWQGPQTKRPQKDVTPLCTDGWESSIAGLASSSFAAQLMTDYAALGVDAEAFALLAATAPTSVLPAGKTPGSIAYSWQSLSLGYEQQLQIGEVAAGNLSGNATGPVIRGLVLADAATQRTVTANLTGQQLGTPSATQRIYSALHVLSASGTTPSVTVALQSATTLGGTYTTRLTHTAFTAPGSEWLSVAGPVAGSPAFWRVALTISGTTPSFSLVVCAGIATP